MALAHYRQFDSPGPAFGHRRRGHSAVKIEGVEHEFSSIKGVVEDARTYPEFKQVPFLLPGRFQNAHDKQEGAGEVTSADIESDGDVEVLDDGIHLATISGSGSFNVEMRLSAAAASSAEFNMTRTFSGLHSHRFGPHAIKKVNTTSTRPGRFEYGIR